MKKFLFGLLSVVAIVLAYHVGGAEGVATATLMTPIVVKGVKDIVDFNAYLEAKGLKDVSHDVDKYSDEEVNAYYLAKVEFEKIELEQKVDKLMSENDPEKIEALKSELNELKEAASLQGKVLNALKANTLSGRTVNGIEDSISKAFTEHKEDFAKSAKGKHEFGFTINKTVGDYTFANNVTGTVPQAQRLPGVNDIAERVAVTYNLCNRFTTDRNVVEWVYETAQEGTPGSTAEGATKNQIDNNFVVASESLKKYTAYLKVSTEMLDDASFMEMWLRNKLILRLFLAVDDAVLNDAGAGNDLDGLLNQSTAFAAGTFANTVYNANDVDSLTVAINQIKIANQDTGNLAIMMHPSDVTALKLEKVSTTDKRYVEKLSMVGDSLSLSGVPIVENVNITAGDFLVGDFSKANIVEKGSISVEVGLDGNDLTKNMRTFVAEWRGALFVENNNTTCFVTGTFATTNAALLLT